MGRSWIAPLRRVNNGAMRKPMLSTRAMTDTRETSCTIAVLADIAFRLVGHAMGGRGVMGKG